MEEPVTESASSQPFSPDVVLFETGLRHPTGRWIPGRSRFTPYREILHLAALASGLVIATTRGTWSIPRRALSQPSALGALETALRDRIGATSQGAQRLAASDALDRRLAGAPRPLLGRSLAVLCVLIAALAAFFPGLADALAYRADAVQAGEAWRLVSLHVLHVEPWHLAINALAVWVLGDLVDLTLGRARAATVAVFAAAGAALGCEWMSYPEAMGASGIVAGLAGGLFWLEMRMPAAVPGPWRLPRRPFMVALVLDGFVLALVPGIAHAAHVGGFLAGALATALLAPAAARSRSGPFWAAAVNTAGAAALGLALIAGANAVVNFEDTWERRAHALIEQPDATPGALNDAAWTIAIHPDVSQPLLELAEALAVRAVDETQRANPAILDTLAEVYFMQGRHEEALEVNREALMLTPDNPYLREQRRRYRGERDADDRPEVDDPEEDDPLPDAPGIRV